MRKFEYKILKYFRVDVKNSIKYFRKWVKKILRCFIFGETA